jgi:predicted dehydrogenase
MAGVTPSQDLRVGIVGAGAIAQVAHLPVLRKLKGVQVAAICDADGAKARALASRSGIAAAFTDIEELLEFGKVDAVVICAPNHLHEAHVVSALAAGAHVLVERPLALTSAGVARVLKAADRYRRVVHVAMNHRFRSDVQAVQSFLTHGELGELSAIRAGWHVFRAARQQMGWRSRKAESGGGAMMDLGLPMLDLALWIAGYPAVERLSAKLERAKGAGAVDEDGAVFLHCADGLDIFVEVSWRHVGAGERTWLDIKGAKGSASLAPLRVFKELHGAPVDVTPTGATSRESVFSLSYRSEWAYFLAAVRGEITAEPPEDQLQLHKVLEAIYRSADEQREVKL